jgi:biopolymer transport protein ExbB/TolQ
MQVTITSTLRGLQDRLRAPGAAGGAAGIGRLAAVADGILTFSATIAGLAVAVPAVIAQFWFSRRTETASLRMSSIINRALDSVWRGEPES